VNTVPSIRQATSSDYAKLKEIIDLSFPRFFRFFASHSVDSKDGHVLLLEVQGAVAGFAKLIDFQVGGGKKAVSSGLPFIPPFGDVESP
jgi:hypothetical protein